MAGSTSCPAKVILADDCTNQPNSSYDDWMLIDQNFAATLFSTISPFILLYVHQLDSIQEIWSAVKRRLQSSNRPHVIQLKNELYNVSMMNQTMT